MMTRTTTTHVALVGDQVQQAFLDAQQVRRGRHHHVDEDLRHDGDEGVLPGEGVEEGGHGVDDLRQRPAGRSGAEEGGGVTKWNKVLTGTDYNQGPQC